MDSLRLATAGCAWGGLAFLQVVAYKLSASFALAQSIQINQFEQAVADLVQMHQSVPKDMALHGKVELSKKEISKRESA